MILQTYGKSWKQLSAALLCSFNGSVHFYLKMCLSVSCVEKLGIRCAVINMLRHKANMEDGYRMQYSFIVGDIDITSKFSCDIRDITCNAKHGL